MSTLSGSPSVTPGINLYSQNQIADGSATSNSAAAAVASAANQSASAGETKSAHHGHHHHGGGGASGLQNQIQQAVTSALDNSDDGSDPNQTIQNAIQQALQNPAQAASDPALAGTPTGANATGIPGQPGSATFEEFLQSKGVDTDQFKSDLAAAFQQAHSTGGQADLSSAFSSLPPGSVVDASA